MLYALGFIGLFTIGGLTGLFLAALAVDVHVHDTYFVVAHFHYIMVGGMVMAYLGGLHFWWPKITGRLYPEVWRQALRRHHLRRLQPDFLPAVHPRLPGHAAPLSRLSAGVSGAQCALHRRRLDPGHGYMLPLIYLIWSLRWGNRPAKPVAGDGILEIDDGFAAAEGQFRRRRRRW